MVFKLTVPSSKSVENGGLVDPILGSFWTPYMAEIAIFGYFLYKLLQDLDESCFLSPLDLVLEVWKTGVS